MSSRKLLNVCVVVMVGVSYVWSDVSVMVYSKDEALHEHNISKPRIYIENTGTEPISDFYCLYYFTAEGGNIPVLEDYYTPFSKTSLMYLGHNQYAVRYDFSGITLFPGQVLPDQNGNVIGIHYADWKPLCKGNDHSFQCSHDFAYNPEIAVFCPGGFRIDGCHRGRKRFKTREQRSVSKSIYVHVEVTH